ncbi:MAG: hypothetical protein KJ623_02565 [Nanoarchaeota archaeon]|nr:hypothetical protein [Nanoarchaeota archaeon]MBU0963309.1 hypothetical protein [Nanoarchaeota archaeon]
MKLPKQIKDYCKHCNKTTIHKVGAIKTGTKRGSLKKGSIQRAMRRGRGIGFGNKGRWGSKPTKPKRSGFNEGSKMATFRLSCSVCNKGKQLTLSRAKKVELK